MFPLQPSLTACCLVSFGLAVAYLLRDGVRTEALAIAVSLFGLVVYLSIGRGAYLCMRSTVHPSSRARIVPVRASVAGVGPLMEISADCNLCSLVLFAIDWFRRDDKARRWAWNILSSQPYMLRGHRRRRDVL